MAMADIEGLNIPKLPKGLLDDPRRVAGLVVIAAGCGLLIGFRLGGGIKPSPVTPGLPTLQPCRGCIERDAAAAEARVRANNPTMFPPGGPVGPSASAPAPVATDEGATVEVPFDHTRPATGPVVSKDTASNG